MTHGADVVSESQASDMIWLSSLDCEMMCLKLKRRV